MPRFRIRACSAPFRFGPEQFVIPVFGEPGRREDYALLIPSQSRVSCRGKYFFLNSRTVHLPSENVSGRDCWFVAQNRRVKPFFDRVSICINACLKWASYEMLLPDPRSGFNPRPFAESNDLPNYRHVIFYAVYPARVSSGSVNAELSSALFQSLAILTSCNRCSWSSTLRDLPESICALIFANIGADSPKGT